MSAVQNVDQPDAEQYQAFIDRFETAYIATQESANKLHLHDCQSLAPDNSDYRTVPLAAYPHGYYDICRYCLVDHNNDDIKRRVGDE